MKQVILYYNVDLKYSKLTYLLGFCSMVIMHSLVFWVLTETIEGVEWKYFIHIFFIELLYFCLRSLFYRKVKNIAILLFVGSIFFNISSLFFIMLLPYLYGFIFIGKSEIYLYFIYSILFYFIIAFIYTVDIPSHLVFENSYNKHINKKRVKGSTITFFNKETIPVFLKPFNLVPAIIFMYFLLVSFVHRGNSTSQYYFLLACSSLMPVLIYSEMCYSLLAIKYFFKNVIGKKIFKH